MFELSLAFLISTLMLKIGLSNGFIRTKTNFVYWTKVKNKRLVLIIWVVFTATKNKTKKMDHQVGKDVAWCLPWIIIGLNLTYAY